MKPQNKFIQKWQEAKQEFGASELARTAKVDLRTVNNAIKGNEIDPSTFEKINKAVLKLKSTTQSIIAFTHIYCSFVNVIPLMCSEA